MRLLVSPRFDLESRTVTEGVPKMSVVNGRTLFLARGLAGALVLSLASMAHAAPEAADLLLVNGRVYTLAWAEPSLEGTPAASAPRSSSGWRPDAEAVAMRGGRIVFVGGTREAQAYRGPKTRMVDLAGATVLPGLVDSHTHVAELGEMTAKVDLTDVKTEEEAVARVVARAAQVAKGQWIVGQGWDEGAWANRYPTVKLLSEKVPDHPVFLASLHGFAGWGNRLAFARAGITRDTQAPEGGEILKDAEGNPAGTVLNRAVPLLASKVPPPTEQEYKERVRAGLLKMAQSGYVAVHEAGAETRHLQAFEALEAEGRLPVRVYAMLSARDAELCRRWLVRGPDATSDRMLVTRPVKAYYDGALGSRGARLLADYSDRPGHRGISGEGYGFDQKIVADMMRAGFQVGVHAIGDAGNRETLDFIGSVIGTSEKVRSLRHRIEHAQVVHPDDVPRFARLPVIASMEPPHCAEDKTWAEARLGPERVKGAYAWRTLRRAGARLALNSDLPGSDHDIFYGLHAAITRRDKQLEPRAGWHPGERLTPEEAVRGYTSWNAYAAFSEPETGILAPGRWADLTVMDVDPLVLGSTEPGQLLAGRIVATVVGGRVVHETAAFGKSSR